jgi:hypothetical protein
MVRDVKFDLDRAFAKRLFKNSVVPLDIARYVLEDVSYRRKGADEGLPCLWH